MTNATGGRWRKALAVRLPGEIIEAVGFRRGKRVQAEVEDGNVVIRRAAPRFTLAKSLRGKSAAEWRAAQAAIVTI